MPLLFSKTTLGAVTLQNRMVMAPMTRDRAIGNVPNDLMKQYYVQRASAGLIITEGTSPSPNGLGYPCVSGIYSEEMVSGWKRISDAVHAQDGKMFMQLMHCGRVGHPLNLPDGAYLLGPSAIAAKGLMYTEKKGMQPQPVPLAMTESNIRSTVLEFVRGAKNAIAAGMDGIELHGANGYLLEQFIRPSSNHRTDGYGGTIENRARFVLDVIDAVINAIGKDKLGIRLSPYGVFNDMHNYDQTKNDYAYLAQQIEARGLIYIHLVDHSAMGAPMVPDSVKAMFRSVFKGTLILSGGYDAARAESDLAMGKCDLVGVGRPFIANPDLVARWQSGAASNMANISTFYSPGAKGYTDYPTLR